MLLENQAKIAAANYGQHSGKLSDALQGSPSVPNKSVTVSYLLHIRFLDMKKGRKGKKKKRYAPIYNKYVYGYLSADVRRTLNSLVRENLFHAIEDTFE